MAHFRNKLLLIASILAFGVPVAVMAQSAPGHVMKPGMSMAGTPAGAMAEAEVRKIDKDAKKITLKHGDIPNLEMPPMTMVFQVKDPALLDTVKVGDKVRFKAEKAGGAFVVTELQLAK